MPFPFGNKKHSTKHHSPELPLNGHQVNKNLTQFNDAKNFFESISNINSPGHLEIHEQQQNNVPTNEFVLQTKCLVFKCQLADGSPTVFVSDFSNMKQLYEKIVDAFKKKGIHVNISEVRIIIDQVSLLCNCNFI